MASSRAPAVSAAGPLRKTKTVPAPISRGYRGLAMEFGIFNLMGSRDPAKPSAQTFAEVAEQTRLADELGYAIAWFAEHHFSNYCLCASPLMMVSHCAAITKKHPARYRSSCSTAVQSGSARCRNRDGRRAFEWSADARSRCRLPALRI